MMIHGKCHCGNIAFSLAWEPDPTEIPARACGCSFCTKHGGVWTSNPRGALKVTVKDPSLVSNYAFGTRTAEFHICSQCGIVPVVTSRIDGHLYAAVSGRTRRMAQLGDPSSRRRVDRLCSGDRVAERRRGDRLRNGRSVLGPRPCARSM